MASTSTDNIGITSYEWDFDDGFTATGKNSRK
ncbi:MAG: PKD domain-containing protein [Thermoplasmatota archaeon]